MQAKIFTSIAFAAIAILPRASMAAWQIEPTHTNVSFAVGHMGLTHTPGMFRSISGTVNFDENNVAASSVSLSMDTASIDTANAQRDAALRSADWFNAQAYPKITFVSTGVQRVDATHYAVAGNLTVRGKTLPVTFNTIMTGPVMNPFLKVPSVGFSGSAHVSRSAFGMLGYLPVVADDVELIFQLEMNKVP
ncbi:YceI family protein [Janthinobacterium sp. Mn2066]|uniref:YceI family protein n=1 Tax=Janthinobacterium sp. Mn2066 TaxID=3395264 RepID=UPI003BC8DD61